jgi:hypothetical protein
LVLGDRPAEGLADLGAANGEFERAFGDADAAGGDADAAKFEAAGRLVEALPLDAANQVIRRDAVVIPERAACMAHIEGTAPVDPLQQRLDKAWLQKNI